jgi:hypothetical protein|tara:strand:- start:252 stop:362 length:111 start_codon:yes stop_codon:yes gene_type:complete
MTDHGQLAVGLFSHGWSFFNNKQRAAEQDKDILHAH